MPRINTTAYALLGLLSWKPMSGYDIKKFIELGLAHFWAESYGQLFPTLKRFVAEGLATCREEQSAGRRRKKTYRITPKGRRRFLAWLALPPADMQVRNESLLKFFLASRQSRDEGIRLVEQYRDQQSALLALYGDSEKEFRVAMERGELPAELESLIDWPDSGPTARAARDQLQIFFLTLRHGVLHVQARLSWCEEALSHLRHDPSEGS